MIDSDGSISCEMGSEAYNHEADEANDIDLEDNIVSTSLDVPKSPDFGDCIMWSIYTLGSSTNCNPAVIPI